MSAFKYRSAHFVGIKGTGMSAAARILKAEGVNVTGSDVDEVFPTDEGLRAAGITPLVGFRAENVDRPEVVVVSAAYGENHPEVVEARRKGIPVLTYPELVGELMASRRGIAVAGTHGKTTTTAMVAHILAAGDLDPQAIIGVGDAYTGKGEFLVVESCEYRRHFLHYPAEMAVVTSIELDHPDYFRDEADYESAFREFATRLPAHGLLVVCADDPRAAALPTAARRLSYGSGPDADVSFEPVSGPGNRFRVRALGKDLGEFTLRIPGRHNVLNSLAALSIALEVGVPVDTAREALASFPGVRRRFELVGERGGAVVYDDYAHHPTAIAATIRACREALPGRRVWAVFQPHTYSRTAALLGDFAAALATADRVVLAEVYASAREKGRRDVSSRDIAALIPAGPERTAYFRTLDEIPPYLEANLEPGDVVLTMGAGDVWRVGRLLVASRRPSGSL